MCGPGLRQLRSNSALEYWYRAGREWGGEAEAQSVIGVGRAVLGAPVKAATGARERGQAAG